MVKNAPSQKTLVNRFISWPLIKKRLAQHTAIARNFPLELLQSRSNTAPYFCHYMAWRLGTIQDEHIIFRINKLIEHAERLPNWRYEQALLRGGDFSDFWSLIWQLQIAEYLSNQNMNVSWNQKGPDLVATDVNGRKLFVECYVYRKSFGDILFIEEILNLIGSDLHISYNSLLPLRFPQSPTSRSDEISWLMAPLIDTYTLEENRHQAKTCYPIILSTSEHCSLAILLKGPNIEKYDPTTYPQEVGDPSQHLETALREAANAKAQSNNLAEHKPNIVVANFILSRDAQLALALNHKLPNISPNENIDAFAFTIKGIDTELSKHELKLLIAGSETHPAHAITTPLTF